MKVLIMSDSHSSLSFMHMCVDKLCPNVIVHLGDHYDDGKVISEKYPYIPLYQVPGNCDSLFTHLWQPEIICSTIGGVMCYMTHGHKHYVKSGLGQLMAAARVAGAKAVLFGHTHEAVCEQIDDLWVINPGSCRGFGGSVALMEIEDNKISSCRILRQEDI